MKRALALVMLAVVTAACSDGGKPAVRCPPLDAPLPGMRAGAFPWPAEHAALRERLARVGLPALTQEGRATDIHFRVSITIDGQRIVLPSNIGIAGREVSGGRMVTGFVSPIHTHDSTGLVHIHSHDVRLFTLGQFFDVWGVALTDDRIGGFCEGEERVMSVNVGGRPWTGPVRDIVLAQGTAVDITYR